MAFGQPRGEKRAYRPRQRRRARSRKCHVSRLRLRGQRLTGTSGRGVFPSLSLGYRLPARRSRPHESDSQASPPRPSRGRSRAGKNAAPCLGHDALPSLLLASVLSRWFLPSVSSSRLSALRLALSQTPTIPFQRDAHRRHVPAGDTGLRPRPSRPPGPERGRLGFGVSLHQR